MSADLDTLRVRAHRLCDFRWKRYIDEQEKLAPPDSWFWTWTGLFHAWGTDKELIDMAIRYRREGKRLVQQR